MLCLHQNNLADYHYDNIEHQDFGKLQAIYFLEQHLQTDIIGFFCISETIISALCPFRIEALWHTASQLYTNVTVEVSDSTRSFAAQIKNSLTAAERAM